METRVGTITFPRTRGSGPRTERQFFNFTSPVRQAVAALTGTTFGFAQDDHHLGTVTARVVTSVDDDVVSVDGLVGVRDWSGEWDDDYEGSLQFVLLAELEVGSLPANLSVTGVERNQAIQFFRSVLDASTARADNWISLIAEKGTVLRLFVDTQTDPSRPAVASVSGLLEVRPTGVANWTSISPLNAPIPPKTDAQIRRSNANDTLNFLIPGAFCTGRLDYRVKAFDAAHPSQPGFTSGTVQGTLEFTRVEPLRVRGVAVNFTGTPPAGPPTVVQLRSTLGWVQKVFPTGRLEVTGFDVLDYAGDFTGESGGGCGPGWGGLLDRLREMQGDDEAVYYGLLASATPTGSISGCGGGDGRVAAGFVGDGPTAAQEIGHAFGRDHAPCGNPGNVDPNYPVYGTFRMGSIGEVGIDDAGNVKDPETSTDFMSYCGSNWISPYTYDALRSRFPAVPESPRMLAFVGAASGGGGPERRAAPQEHLFLRFRIYRNRKVRIFPSFHYVSQPFEEPGRWTPFTVELRDRHDNVLAAHRVTLRDPHRDLDSASLDFLKPIAFPDRTTRVVIVCDAGDCDHEELVSVDVPADPPKLRITQPKPGGTYSGKVTVSWRPEESEEGQTLHYMVRYSNDGGTTWRAVGPKTKKTEMTVDLDTRPGGPECMFQVLATEGIRTGSAVSGQFTVAERPREASIDMPSDEIRIPEGEHVVLIGDAYSAHHGSADASQLVWASDLDGEIGRGHELDLANLRPGRHTIVLTAPDGVGGESGASVEVVIDPRHQGTHHDGEEPSGEQTGKRQRRTSPGNTGGEDGNSG